MAVDNDGNIYLVGTSHRDLYFTEEEGEKINFNESSDVVWINLIKLTLDSNFVWARCWIGIDNRYYNDIYSVCTDSFGDPYVSGVFRGTVDFGDSVEHEPTAPGRNATIWDKQDAFLVKYSSDGDLQWVRTWGGTRDDHCGGLAADNSGNIYVIGHSNGIVDFDLGPGEDLRGVEDHNTMYLMKVTSDGSWY